MEVIVVAVVLVALIGLLIADKAPPAAAMLGAVVVLVVAGVLPVEQAFAGFANPAVVAIAGLFVVAQAVRDHAGIEVLISRVLGDARSGERVILARLLPGVTLLSGVSNNTPLVATTAPLVRGWAERHGVAPAHLLMPLSFATILGGLLTTIGTGPNLVVSGSLASAGLEPFGLFTMTPATVLIAAVGCGLIVWLAPTVLPDRRATHERIAGHEREYAIRLLVQPDGSADGATVAQAGLRDLASTYLASIVRRGREFVAVAPEFELEGGDELVFVGRVDDVHDLVARDGLIEAEHPQTSLLDGHANDLVECVIAAGSPLVATTLKAASFRGRYGGAVIAIHRAGERINEKLGSCRLQPGDTLLVKTDPAFVQRWQGHADFAVVVPLRPSLPEGRDRHRRITLITGGAMLLTVALGLAPLVSAIMVACGVLVASGALPFRRALDALDLDVLIIVASAIAVGAAMEQSGVAATLASTVVQLHQWLAAPMLIVAVLVVATIVLTELVTNVAAAALMVPVALDVAAQSGMDPTGLAVTVAIGASASFLTPIGYQTNTIVYGLGGYRFGDYWRLGLPLSALTVVSTSIIIPLLW